MRCPRVDAQLSSGLLPRCPSREHPYSLGPTPSPHTHLPPQLHAGPVPVCLPHTSTSDAPQSCGNRVTMHLEQATTSRHSVPGLAAITPTWTPTAPSWPELSCPAETQHEPAWKPPPSQLFLNTLTSF